jgi:D-beta-D-heptose 7-phosphate kinase/D-beta-D-heptose 1-phosphate adenosyltransferase
MKLNNNRLEEIIHAFRGKRIAVVGDLILDVYVWGKASRISPEAPVPVVRVNERTQCLGGAANVMRNVMTMGGEVYAFGVIGDDDAGQEMLSLLDKHEIDRSFVCTDSTRRTTEKQRLIAGSQQLVRIDFEDVHEISLELQEHICRDFIALIDSKKIDAVIFEDYAKGMLCTEMLQKVNSAAKKAGIIVALDPHPGHPMEVSGLSVLKPNRAETFGLAGLYCTDKVDPVKDDSALMTAANTLIEKWEPENLLVTLGGQGMALFEKDGGLTVIPTRAREVFDVSGCGDTVISAFVLSILGDASPAEAAEIANHAAGVVAGKVGTVSVTLEELRQSFKGE